MKDFGLHNCTRNTPDSWYTKKCHEENYFSLMYLCGRGWQDLKKKILIWILKSWLEDASPLKQEKDFDSWIHYERVFKLFNMLFLCLIKFHCKSIY